MKNYRELHVWQKAHQLVLDVYAVTRDFLANELYGLVSQMRRCAVSIPSNIAEGCGRNGDAELARFCDIASGSASELDYQLTLARDLNYIHEDVHQRLAGQLSEARRMLTGFLQAVRPQR